MNIRIQPTDPASFSGAGSVVPDSFLQTPFWAEFKASHGWKPFYFLINSESGMSFPLSVLVRSMGRFGSLAYIPLGPSEMLLSQENPGDVLLCIAKEIAEYLPKNVLCIRFDPPVQRINSLPRGLRKASTDVQPPDTVMLDLTLTEDTLLEGMKQKWRYNIRLGEKKGIEILSLTGRNAADKGIDIFYSLYRETAARDGIAIHTKDYYRDLFLAAVDGPHKADARLYVASHEGDNLAAIIVLFTPKGATYLYGASSNEKRNLMPAYALQWRAIRDAKAAGCQQYDFYGIPPTDDPVHPMHGLYRFKTGFGGRIIHRGGSYDVPLLPGRYALWRFAEQARSLWFKRIKKILTKGIPSRS